MICSIFFILLRSHNQSGYIIYLGGHFESEGMLNNLLRLSLAKWVICSNKNVIKKEWAHFRLFCCHANFLSILFLKRIAKEFSVKDHGRG